MEYGRANQERLDCRTTALPLAEGHWLQVFSPVRMLSQFGHCHAMESQRCLVILRCFCTARLTLPSSQKCSSSMALPDTVMWNLVAVHLYMEGCRTCDRVRY